MPQSFGVRIIGPARHTSDPSHVFFDVYGLRSGQPCELRRTREGWFTRTYGVAWGAWRGPFATAHEAIRAEGPVDLSDVVFTLLSAEGMDAGDVGRIAPIGVVHLTVPTDVMGTQLIVRAIGAVQAWSHGAFEEVTPLASVLATP